MGTPRRKSRPGVEVLEPHGSRGVRAFTAILLAWAALVAVVGANLLADRNGVLWDYDLPIGHDFHVFYTAACAAADGRVAGIFVPEQLWAMAHEYLGVDFATNGLWLYPPHYLLLIAPLALLSYLAAYLAFVAATLTAYLVAAWRLGLGWRWLAVLAVAPTTVFTIQGGQNGLLTGALVVPGIVFMRSRPHLAGVLFGVLTIKPHLGLLVIVALVTTRAWRAAAVAAATAASLAAIATAAYGFGAWTGPFQHTLPVLTRGVSGVASYWATGFVSVYPHAAMVLGAGPLAWAIQIAAATLAIVATYRVIRRSSDAAEHALVVSVGTMLAFPYLFFYDLPMVTLAVAFYAATRPHLARHEVAMLSALAITPMLVISGVPMLAPGVLVAAFVYLWRRPDRVASVGGGRADAGPSDVPAKPTVGLSGPRPRAGEGAAVRPAHAILIVLAVAAVYANSLAGPFILDDAATIVTNPAIRSVAGALDPPRDTPIAGRPVVALTFAANYALGGLGVGGYHVVNLAVHAICALLLFGIVRRTLALPRLDRFASARDELAIAVALIWAVHPLNTEAVNYITQRTESLMGLFFVLTLYASVRSSTSKSAAAKWQVLAVIACVVGMGCKETMAVAPIAVVLYDRAFLFASFGECFRRRGRFYAALAASWLVLAYLLVPGPRTGSAGLATDVSPWGYLINQAVMVSRYLRLAFWPSDLVVNYGPPRALSLADVWPYALLVGELLLAAFAVYRRKPQAGFLAVCVFLTLVPASSVLPIATQVAAERRMYLPMMGLVALVVMGAYGLERVRTRMPRAGAIALLAGVVVALSVSTVVRNREYASPLVLAETVLQRWPTDVAHGMVGAELTRLGRDEEAIRHLSEGARSNPTARYNLGVALFNSRRFDEAIRELEILIAEHPLREEIPWSRRLIGQAHAAQGRRPEAIAAFRAVLEMTPEDDVATGLLVDTLQAQGVELGTAGDHRQAVAVFEQAVALEPGSARLRANLATALIDVGDVAAAASEAQQAIALDRADAVGYDLLGRALALQGRLDEAIDRFEEALRLNPSDAMIREDLQRVLAVRDVRSRQPRSEQK